MSDITASERLADWNCRYAEPALLYAGGSVISGAVVLDNHTSRPQVRLHMKVQKAISAHLPYCLTDDPNAPKLRLVVGKGYRHAGLAWVSRSAPRIQIDEEHASDEVILHELLHALLGAQHCEQGILRGDGQIQIETADLAAIALAGRVNGAGG